MLVGRVHSPPAIYSPQIGLRKSHKPGRAGRSIVVLAHDFSYASGFSSPATRVEISAVSGAAASYCQYRSRCSPVYGISPDFELDSRAQLHVNQKGVSTSLMGHMLLRGVPGWNDTELHCSPIRCPSSQIPEYRDDGWKVP